MTEKVAGRGQAEDGTPLPIVYAGQFAEVLNILSVLRDGYKANRRRDGQDAYRYQTMAAAIEIVEREFNEAPTEDML